MIGKTIHHYLVLSSLGKGGMGEVYLAEDTKLKRKLALKVLPPEMSAEPERIARFQREARAIAALNHPNIVTIYSVEEAEGVHFITMELVEGKTLDQLIPARGMSFNDFLEIAVPMTEALAVAHETGITHRDLKPANLMVTNDGRVKILDFGLAKFVPPGESLTSELVTLSRTQQAVFAGTVPYMAPEQIEGKRVDPRTDVFSLGILLYEMAAGGRPFAGTSSISLISSILKDTPKPLTELKPDVPQSLARIVEHCLEKNPEARYRSGREVLAELSKLKSADTRDPREVMARPGQDLPRIAVLPFRNRGGDPELESFADGLTEDIITALSHFSVYFVVAASSSFRFKGKAVDVRDVARELGARYVIEGSLRKAAANIRVNVQLADAVTGAQLWAENFDRDLRSQEVFALQDQLTDQIVATVADIHGVLARSMGALVKSKPAEALDAYESVLQWFAYIQRVVPEEHLRARTALELTVRKEPYYADAWACLSDVYNGEYRFSFNPRENPMERALAAARRAVELDATNHLAFYSLALAHFFRRDLEAFRSATERAVTLNPRDSHTLAELGILIAYAGDWDRGLALAKKATSLNPHHPGWYLFGAFMDHYRNQRFEQAFKTAQKVNMPGHHLYHATLAASAAQLGRHQEAKAAVDELLKIVPDFGERARGEWVKWNFPRELIESLLDGLRIAGLEIPRG